MRETVAQPRVHMKLTLSPGLAFASLAALAVLIAGWLLPWHDIISGEEQLAPAQMPQTRQQVEQAASEFGRASEQYKQFIQTHDLSALLAQSTSALAAAKSDPTDSGTLARVRDLTAQVQLYAQQLESYSQASDAFLSALRGYDDQLMSWTRGLFSASESLRSQTWPFVEHLKLYPQPVGLKTDPPMVGHDAVAQQVRSLQAHSSVLDAERNPPPTTENITRALDGISQDIGDIWASGRSVEYVAGLNNEYRDELAVYDTRVQQAAASPVSATPGTPPRQLAAWGLTLMVSVVTLGGLAALFMPRTETAL